RGNLVDREFNLYVEIEFRHGSAIYCCLNIAQIFRVSCPRLSFERAKVSPSSCLRISLPRIQAVIALNFSNQCRGLAGAKIGWAQRPSFQNSLERSPIGILDVSYSPTLRG